MINQPFSLFTPFEDCLRVTLFTKDDKIDTDEKVAHLLGVDAIAAAKQVHGGHAEVIEHIVSQADIEADALITNIVDVPLSIRNADCQTFILYDPVQHAAGVIHAGWRGLLTRIIPNCIEKMMEAYNSQPEDLLVGGAPSLCQRCSDFTNPIEELPGVDEQFFDGRYVDLQGIANAQLCDVGIQTDHIERMNRCTRCKPDKYYSYRAEPQQVKAGKRNVLTCVLL